MTPVGLLSPSRGELWEFVAIDRNGERRKYQSHSSAVVTESQMLEHLRRQYPYCEVVGLRRITSGDYRPPCGEAVQSHLFEHGTKQKFYDDFARLSLDQKSETLKYVSTLPPVKMGNGESMPDPLQVAVLTAQMMERRKVAEQPEPPRRQSILDQFRPIRHRLSPIH